MALGKHLVQAVPFVYALQCPTGKVDKNNMNINNTNSHRSDIATENSFSEDECEARSSGGPTLKESGAQ